MDQIIVGFDCDGTLISNTSGLGMEKLNIDVYHLLMLFSKMKNVKVIVWSGGGKEYAERIVAKYGLYQYVEACFGKNEYDETIDGHVDICFDDIHSCKLADKNIIVRMK